MKMMGDVQNGAAVHTETRIVPMRSTTFAKRLDFAVFQVPRSMRICRFFFIILGVFILFVSSYIRYTNQYVYYLSECIE